MSIPPDSSHSQPARDAGGRPAPVSPDQLLPPVEPPSAGFLLQLFVVPAIIVACVVLVWFGIETLARSGQQDPAEIVAGLRSANGFQQAKDLADMLAVPERYAALRDSRELAQGVAEYVDQLIAEGDDKDSAITMRYILVTLLGEMHVDDGLPVLIKAATSDPERDVRRKAINAIAVLAGTLAGLNPPQHVASDKLVDALVKLANDQDELLRSETAFAIGVVAQSPEADPRLVEALGHLADDPYTDARFNAAVGLARIGSPLAPMAVGEMLDFEALAASIGGEKPITTEQSPEQLRSQQAYKRNTIVSSALSAAGMLLEKNLPAASLAPLEAALKKFIADAPSIQDPARVPDEQVDAAKRVLERVKAAR
jgi:HEAT repeat protein